MYRGGKDEMNFFEKFVIEIVKTFNFSCLKTEKKYVIDLDNEVSFPMLNYFLFPWMRKINPIIYRIKSLFKKRGKR